MKRLSTFLMAFLSIMLFAPFASAQKTAIGSRVEPDQLQDGMEVVFECRSGPTSKGHYLTSDVHFPPANQNPALAFEGTNNIPEKMKFVLVKSEVPNPVTGDDQWYIQSVATGKYLTFEWNWTNKNNGAIYPDDRDKWINMYDNGVQVWVNDTASAKAFVLHCNEFDNRNGDANGNYGSKSYGSSTADWGVGTYTIVNIFDNSDGHYTNNTNSDGGGFGRVFLANEFEVSNFNIRWYSRFQDTNVWDIREVVDPNDPINILASYVDQLPDDIAEGRYLEGTDPGFVGDHAAYEEFFDAYNNAIDGSITTSEQATAALTRLQNAYEALNKAIVQVKDGGYYYIKTANYDFTSAGNGEFAWTAPYDATHAGWNAFKENDNRFIWQVKFLPTADSDTTSQSTYKTGRMYYTFQNVGSKYYLGTGETTSRGSMVTFTGNDSTRIALIDLGGGQWNISSKQNYYDNYPPSAYEMNGHANGGGTKGLLAVWYGERSSTAAWYIREVPADQIAGINDPERVAIDSLTIALTSYSGLTDGAEVGPEVGKPHSQEIVDNLNNALTAATAYAYGDATGTIDEINAASKAVVDAGEAFKKEVNVVPDGYYRIRSNYANFAKNDNDAYFALYNDSLPGWKHYQKTTEQLWKITSVAGGYTIQNVKNGMYLNKAVQSANGSLVDMTTRPETTQMLSTIKPNGKWGIYNAVDSTFGYDPAGHGSGAGEVGRLELWSPRAENGGTSWALIPVSDADAQALIAAEPQNELNLKLKAKVEEARATFNASTDYTIGEPIVKAADQLYANNWSPNEGANIANMIDGDKNTYWNSTWESGQEQDPDNPHYLRIYDEAGFPDTVQVQWVMRQNGTWHREAVKMRVQVSNDADTWTSLYELYPADVTNNGKFNLTRQLSDSVHYIVNGLKGYKYVRFLTEVNRHSDGGVYVANDHMMIEYAEYNLYPVTGISASSASQQVTRKALADDLFAAIQEAQPQYMNGTATQATLDKLTAALDAFNQGASNDSTLLMAQYNALNLTAGDRIGEFPEADLNAYKQTVQTVGAPILAKVSANQNLTAAEITETVAKLKEAYITLYKTMVKPTENTWYTITAKDEARPDYQIASGGPNTHRYGSGYSYILTPRTDADYDLRSAWTLNEDANGRFMAQNADNGGYFGPLTGSGNGTYDYRPIVWYQPKGLEIVPLGDGQVALRDAAGYFVQGNASWYAQGLAWITPDVSTIAQNSNIAWSIESAAAHEGTGYTPWYLSELAQGRAITLTFPFDVESTAKWGDASEDVVAYELVGKVADEKDSLATAYKFKPIASDVVKAGTPAVYIMPGDFQRDIDDSEVNKGQLVFTPVYNTPFTQDADTVNGLVGVLAGYTAEGTVGLFSSDSLAVATNPGVTVQRGYLVPSLVKNLDSADDDDVVLIYVEGAGIVNGIENSKIVAIKHIVNVYTLDGVLIRKQVEAAKATEGLKKGVYIVGNKKVLVK